MLIFSCAMSTFSDPLITKYPPSSYAHSPSSVSSLSVWSCSEQYCDRSMMGTFPMNTLLIFSTSSDTVPSSSTVVTVLVMSTYSGAEYVKLRRRASLGNKVLVMPSASVTMGLDR